MNLKLWLLVNNKEVEREKLKNMMAVVCMKDIK